MARESSLWDWLRRGNSGDDQLHMTRVENMLMKGWPDVEGCRSGTAFWLELKSAPRPKRPETRILQPDDIRPGQPEWLTERWRVGGRAFMLIQVGERHLARRYLIPGNLTHLVADRPEIWLAIESICPFDTNASDLIHTVVSCRRPS